MGKPRRLNDCPNCHYLGSRRGKDFYFCRSHYRYGLAPLIAHGPLLVRIERDYQGGVEDHRWAEVLCMKEYCFYRYALALATQQGLADKAEADIILSEKVR